jgi:cell division protein FtsW
MPLLILTICLMVIGLVMVYSASYDFSFNYVDGDSTYFFRRQMLWMFVGVIAATVATFVDYHYWQRFAVPAMGFTVVLLVAVLLIQENRNGAVRTIWGGSIQPSELAKVMAIIYLAVWLYSKRDRLSDIGFGLLPLSGILGILGGLIVLQPDFSATLTIIMLGGIMFFLAGGDLRQIGFLILMAVIVALLIVMFTPVGIARLQDYIKGFDDLTLVSDQVGRALEAFAQGKWLGLGIGKGIAKVTGLPVPHTDSIYAVIGEETGFVGAAAMVVFYTLLLWRGMTIAKRAPDILGSLIAAGLSIWITVEAFINMAVMVGLLPLAGNALPFISSGGSNLLISMISIGTLLNVSRLSVKNAEENGRNFGAVVDLRRRNGRRSVPRANRSTGIEST